MRMKGQALIMKQALLGACCVLAGCIFESNLGNVRLCAYDVGWTGYDILGSQEGEAYTVEFTRGTNTEPEMGALFIGGMFTVQRLSGPGDENIWEYRGGVRALSSMLDHPSRSYPYAVVGSYFGYFEEAWKNYGRLGVGVEGGFGARLGLGDRAAVDLELVMSYGLFEAWNNLTSTRFGGAITAQW